MNVHFYSPFYQAPEHGGGHRYRQIVEILENGSLGVKPLGFRLGSRLGDKLRGLWNLRKIPDLDLRRTRHRLFAAGCFSAISQTLKTLPRHSTVALQLPDLVSLLTLVAAKEQGHRVVYFPDNIDSVCRRLVRPVSLIPRTHGYLTDELAWFAHADHVFTIAQEETWLLRNQGIPSSQVPYFPTEAMREDLLAVRRTRAGRSFCNRVHLMLGSAINPPTRAGMIAVLEAFARSPQPVPLVIAGNGTEDLGREFRHPAVRFEGKVTPERLRELLIEADAAIVHQDIGVGALTRIPELLMAGVPIIANEHAARSARHYEGVHLYREIKDAAEMLQHPLPTPPVPSPPYSSATDCASTIRALAIPSIPASSDC